MTKIVLKSQITFAPSLLEPSEAAPALPDSDCQKADHAGYDDHSTHGDPTNDSGRGPERGIDL